MSRVMLMLVVCVLCGCASSPPKNTGNLCNIFDEKRSWYKHARKASRKWGVPIATNMAIMHQESRYVSKAKPPRKRIFGIFPGLRKSSAYGYSQAKTSTWAWYKKSTRNYGADRDVFRDAIDFIAWYNHITVKKSRVKPSETYKLYLAYHEGHGGFARGSYRKKSWLRNVAKKVERQANSYAVQLRKCEKRLAKKGWWPF